MQYSIIYMFIRVNSGQLGQGVSQALLDPIRWVEPNVTWSWSRVDPYPQICARFGFDPLGWDPFATPIFMSHLNGYSDNNTHILARHISFCLPTVKKSELMMNFNNLKGEKCFHPWDNCEICTLPFFLF